jgi:hypothetical protein
MKGRIPKYFLLSLLLFGFAKEGEEEQILDELIATTERQLTLQKDLKHLIAKFHTQQDQFHRGPQTKQLASEMVETASTILQMAEEAHYLHLFSPFFVEELKLFAGIAKKHSPL